MPLSTLTRAPGRCLGHTQVPRNRGSQVLEGGDAASTRSASQKVEPGAKAEAGTFERLVSLELRSLWVGGG